MGSKLSTLHATSTRYQAEPATTCTQLNQNVSESAGQGAESQVADQMVSDDSTAATMNGRQRSATSTAGLLRAFRWKKGRRGDGGKREATGAGEGDSKRSQRSKNVINGPGNASSINKNLWTKLMARLSRKMGTTRLTTRGGGGGGGIHGDTHGTGHALIRGTSSVLPISRNPVTTVAYNDDVKDVNENPNADFIKRVGITSRSVHANLVPEPLREPALPQEDQVIPRKTIQVQATSAELLVGLGEFLRCRCRRLRHFDGSEVSQWMRSVDRSLLEHAWQDLPFIGPANVVFVYLLARDAVDPDIVTVGELQAVIMACLYVAFSYVGCEISYPLKPFIATAGVDEATATAGGPGKKRFWHRCLTIMDRSSGEMLRIHQDPSYFADLFRELKSFALSSVTQHQRRKDE